MRGYLLILLILLVAFVFYLILSRPKNEEIVSYVETFLQLFQEDLVWKTYLTLDGQSYKMLIDTGSTLISIPSTLCGNCEGPSFAPPIETSGEVGYGGGQSMDYGTKEMFCEQLGRNISVSIVNSGTNPLGKVLNVLGLLNKSLNLSTLSLDFPNKHMTLDGNLIRDGISTPILESTYLSVQVQFSKEGNTINEVIIDTGTNYVLSDYSFPEGLMMTIGKTQITIPGTIIRKADHKLGSSIILGYFILEKYKWEFDLRNKQMWVYV